LGWDGSLTKINHGFFYYVIFISHFTKYIWFYLMKNKSDQFLHYFLKLKATVENYFSQEISTVYSNGCEDQEQKKLYLPRLVLLIFLPNLKHLNTMELPKVNIIALLRLDSPFYTKSSCLSFAFQTTAYLVKRLPSSLLEMKSPFEKLYNRLSHYKKDLHFWLHVFP